MRNLFLLMTFACMSCAGTPVQREGIATSMSFWLGLGPDEVTFVRAFGAGECPEAWADGAPLQLKPRAPASPAFPQVVCEAAVPKGVGMIKVGTQSLKLSRALNRIVVLGDTGCRIKKTKTQLVAQACNDPAAWPFAQIAKAAAEWGPDLVIHVGDYHYREAPCPEGNSSCAGAAHGYQADTWLQDFFTPAEPLLKAAPWAFVRGNHESCRRAGQGWFLYLDPRPWSGSCSEGTVPYVHPWDDIALAVVDSSDEGNIRPSLERLKPRKGSRPWILLHRPILTLEKRPALPKALNLPGAAIFAGHFHAANINVAPGFPPELISGNGGTALDTSPVPGARPSVYAYNGFGFMTLERKAGGEWSVVERDPTGAAIEDCVLKSGQVTCRNYRSEQAGAENYRP